MTAEKKDYLKPYVYKVEGAVNFALYDMLNGKFFQISPDGSVEELRETLLKEGLIFETSGIVPNKIMRSDMWDIQNNLHIRVLQIRLNGRREDYCWSRQKKNGDRIFISDRCLDQLIEKCRYIPVNIIRIEAEQEDAYKIEKILREFNCKKVEIYIETCLKPDRLEYFKRLSDGKEIVNLEDARKKMKELKVEIFNFFYSKFFNPCLGHQVAVDTNGEIKCCLWSEEILGNIETDDLKDLIIRGVFDKYWELSKTRIEGCKDCELRVACDDCRVFAMKSSGKTDIKPPYCEYDPYTGN